MITYNQERIIGRAIESLLSQKEYIYEICISDDCSTDGTWKVLNEYASQYPKLFKLHRNNPNLGIFTNIEHTWTMPTGDLVYHLAGDDEAGEDWFKTVVEFIHANEIDFSNELLCIYGNYLALYPNQDSFVGKNNLIMIDRMPLSLYERGLINNRSCTYSTKILKLFHNVSIGKSYIAENVQDAQLHIFSDKRYYIDKLANIYYSGIGVSKSMSEDIKKQYEQTMVYAFQFFDSLGIEFSRPDRNLPSYNIALKHFRWNPSLSTFLKLVKSWILCFDFSLLKYSIDFRRLLFRVLHRLPHKTPIHFK